MIGGHRLWHVSLFQLLVFILFQRKTKPQVMKPEGWHSGRASRHKSQLPPMDTQCCQRNEATNSPSHRPLCGPIVRRSMAAVPNGDAGESANELSRPFIGVLPLLAELGICRQSLVMISRAVLVPSMVTPSLPPGSSSIASVSVGSCPSSL